MDPKPASSPTVEVEVDGCVVVGTRPSSLAVDIFHDIPYASTDRFVQGRLIPLGSGTSGPRLDASRRGRNTLDLGSTTSTLCLDITRPALLGPASPPGQALPVVVYFHGGAFNFGDPSEDDAASFVAHSPRGVVVVGVHYRLGVLGFLAGEGEANLGLWDQRLAVEWVHRWIPAFGGDAALVTLRGVSAGAHSVGHHMLNPSPLPFHRAILESGSPTARCVLSASHPRTLANHADVLSSMLPVVTAPGKVRVDFLLDAGIAVFAQHMPSLTWPFQPVVDGPGGVVPDMPLRLWQQRAEASGHSGTVPPAVITGFCTKEGVDFVPVKPQSFRSFFATLIPSLAPDDLDALEALYPPSATARSDPEEDVRRRLGDAFGDWGYFCPIVHTAHMVSRLGAPAYLYEFAALTSQSSRAASHASHAAFVTRSVGAARTGPPGLRAVSEAMHSRWAEFVTCPDGVLAEETWPRFVTPFGDDDDNDDNDDGTKGRLLVFGEGNDEAIGGATGGTAVRTRTLTEREKEVCRFWWDKMELSQGMGHKGAVSRAY